MRRNGKTPLQREVGISTDRRLLQFLECTLEDVDELLETAGIDEFDRMQADGQVALCLRLLKFATVSKGVEFSALIEDETDPRYEEAEEQRLFCEHVFQELDSQSIREVFCEMLDAAAKGFSIHEIIWDRIGEQDNIYYRGRPATGLWRVRKLKHKDPSTVRFKLDEYDNIVEMSVRAKGSLDYIPVPYDKFLHFVLHRKYQKPYGQSLLVGAWKWWKLKVQAARDFAVYLSKFAAPTPRGKYPKGWQQEDVDALLKSLDSFRVQNAIVYPDEAEVDLLEANRGGDKTFIEAFEHADRAIAKAILGSFMATDGNVKERGSQALGNLHYDVFLLSVYAARHQIADAFREQVVTPLCVYNFGSNAYPPKVSLGPVEDKMVSTMVEAYRQLIDSGVILPDEPFIRENLGLPPMPADVMRRLAVEQNTQENSDASEGEPAGTVSDGDNG